jgi:hypothetical protein
VPGEYRSFGKKVTTKLPGFHPAVQQSLVGLIRTFR